MNQNPLPVVGITLEQKIQDSINLLQEFEPSALEYSEDGYYLCFSGGKDSVVIKDLAIKAGVKFKAYYSCTTIDPPELTRFIKRHHPDVIWNIPKIPMLKMVEKKGLPNMFSRWCCQLYKESDGAGKVKILGVRWAESKKRSKRWQDVSAIKFNNKKFDWVVNPILKYSDDDIWRYILENKIDYCSLYDEGIKRIGCVGCPFGKRDRDFHRWPVFEKLWRKAAKLRFEKMLNENSNNKAIISFNKSDEYFDWWKSNQPMPDKNDCQMGLF